MTNKIMQNNSLYNINNNKLLQDKMSTMMSTQKKITRSASFIVVKFNPLKTIRPIREKLIPSVSPMAAACIRFST